MALIGLHCEPDSLLNWMERLIRWHEGERALSELEPRPTQRCLGDECTVVGAIAP
jgi:hypothetical protein